MIQSALYSFLNSKIKKAIWVIILGFIQALSFDFKFDNPLIPITGLLSIISLFLFLDFIVQQKTKKSALLFSYLYGLVFFGWGLDWVYISMANFGGASLIFAVLANIFVVLYLSLYWMLAGFLIYRVNPDPTKRLIFAPFIIALLEWVRNYFLIGFPWLSLGYAQIDTPLAKTSAIGGIHFTSFIVLMIAAIVAYLFSSPKKVSIKLKNTAPFIALIMIITGFSIIQNHADLIKTKKVTLIQGNIDVITKFDMDKMDHSLDTYVQLTNSAIKQNKTDLVVWPETAIPYFYQQVPEFMDVIKRKQKQNHFDFISGIPVINTESEDVYNAIVFQSQNNHKPNQFYYKENLLPFGEYLPFRKLFSFFKDFVEIPMSDFSRGEIIQAPFQSNGFTIAPSICFEAVFGDRIRLNAKNADVMLNISNDGWFGQSKAQAQHLNIARMRSIENNKYLLRVTNNGITAVIDNHGKVSVATPSFKENFISKDFALQKNLTIYARFGDKLFIILMLTASIVLGLYFKITSFKKSN